MHNIKSTLNQLSFSRRLALTFFICSLLTFLVIDMIMNIIYSVVITTPNTDTSFNSQAFSEFSNNQILSSTSSYLNSGMDLYQQIAIQIYTTYFHFKDRRYLYSSRLNRGINPPEIVDCQPACHDRTKIFFLTPDSTFYDQPYIDKVMSSSASQHYPASLKRINVIYQSKNNSLDVTARTFPATNDFYIPSAVVVQARVAGSELGKVVISGDYRDEFSLGGNATELVAVRLLVDRDDAYMLIEIEVEKVIVELALNYVHSFPNTKVALVRLGDGYAQGYSLLGTNAPLPPQVNLSDYLTVGSWNTTISDYPFVVSTKAVTHGDNNIDKMGVKNLTGGSQLQPNVDTMMRLVIFLNKTETSQPNIVYDQFTKNQYRVLLVLLYGWTFIVMVFVFSVGIVIGDIIFAYFKLIGEKCQQYRAKPEEVKKIYREVKHNSSSSKNQVLIANIVSIMQNVEHKKEENRRNYRVQSDTYPLNPLGTDFQRRMHRQQYIKLETIAKALRSPPSP